MDNGTQISADFQDVLKEKNLRGYLRKSASFFILYNQEGPKIMADELEIDEFTNIQDALNIALEKEKKAYAFYQRGVEQVGDVGVRTLFSELATEEERHITRIQAFIDKEIMREM